MIGNKPRSAWGDGPQRTEKNQERASVVKGGEAEGEKKDPKMELVRGEARSEGEIHTEKELDGVPVLVEGKEEFLVAVMEGERKVKEVGGNSSELAVTMAKGKEVTVIGSGVSPRKKKSWKRVEQVKHISMVGDLEMEEGVVGQKRKELGDMGIAGGDDVKKFRGGGSMNLGADDIVEAVAAEQHRRA